MFFEFLTQQWMLVGGLVVAAVLLWQHESRKSGASLSPQQAINMANSEDGLFVDLRDSAEYGKGHIANAVNIPAPKLESRIAELDAYREKPLILVCKMGQSSGAAGKSLGAKGFSRVYRMTGGMMEWGQQQLPLVKYAMTAPVRMYTTRFCPYCMRARQLLDSKGVAYTDIGVDGDPALREQMRQESQRHTVPQIWVGETHVGGFDDMWLLEQRGELDALLAAN